MLNLTASQEEERMVFKSILRNSNLVTGFQVGGFVAFCLSALLLGSSFTSWALLANLFLVVLLPSVRLACVRESEKPAANQIYKNWTNACAFGLCSVLTAASFISSISAALNIEKASLEGQIKFLLVAPPLAILASIGLTELLLQIGKIRIHSQAKPAPQKNIASDFST